MDSIKPGLKFTPKGGTREWTVLEVEDGRVTYLIQGILTFRPMTKSFDDFAKIIEDADL